jgi:dihydroorotase-like cyclic amidohydrolase
MNKLTKVLMLATALLSATAAAINPVPGAKQQQPLLLQNATVHSVSSAPAIQDVLLVEGKIAAIGTNLAVPADAKQLDLTGKHLYPGLIALINQLGLIEVEAVRATSAAMALATV